MELDNSVIALATLVVGAIVVPLMNFIKAKWPNIQGPKAVWLTFGISAVFAVVVAFLGGLLVAPQGPEDLVLLVGVVFSIATLIYKSIASDAPK